MSTDSRRPLLHLRDDAEATLARTPPTQAPARTAAELLHELQVHQIELEMQNDALRQAQVALEESRDRYVSLFEFAPVGYLTLSRSGQIAAINLTGAALLQEDRKKLLKRRFGRFVAVQDQDRWQHHFLQAVQRDHKQSCELSLQRGDGSIFVARLECLRDVADGTEPTLRITLTDITEQWRAVEDGRAAHDRLRNFAAAQTSHLRELAAELTHAEQSERDRIYELLHDEVQPLLVAARLLLSGLTRTTPQDSRQVAAKACEHIGGVIRVARNLSLELSPPLIREHGLIPALESLCNWVKNNHGLEVELNCAAEAEPGDLAIRLICFNAVRELLMNVAKHAGTPRLTLTLQLADHDILRIIVADSGSGFDPAAISAGSGLAWIKRRLTMFGGSLVVDSRPGHGTVSALSVPLRQMLPAVGSER